MVSTFGIIVSKNGTDTGNGQVADTFDDDGDSAIFTVCAPALS